MLSIKQLKDRIVSITPSGHGHWSVKILLRGFDEFTFTTTNSHAIDRINDDNESLDRQSRYPSKRHALLAIHDESIEKYKAWKKELLKRHTNKFTVKQ